jgi:phosphoribosylamine--glycine ligase
MKVLVVGSGGREHALCWAIARSPRCDTLYCAPGNAGIAAVAQCVDIAANDLDALIAFCQKYTVDFVVVGPEDPLVAGLVDRLDATGIKSFGPSAAAAILEGSKAFMKEFCGRHNIPTAAYQHFTQAAPAREYVKNQGAPIVVKASGLAAGKGVTVATTIDQALAAIDEAMVEARFGDAGAQLVIEAMLVGEEASFFAFCDGNVALPLLSAQDHKTAYDGDKGPNTGGMGAYAPAPVMTSAMTATVMERIINPTMAGMKAEGRPFKGVLYAGLMITDQGPQLIEYNVRFGDPECQVLMMLLESDILAAMIAAHDGMLDGVKLPWRDQSALCVVMASDGYPGSYDKGSQIRGVDGLDGDDLVVFHAGTIRDYPDTIRDDPGALRANGGRVLGITATGPDIAAAQTRAYDALDRIDWPDGFYRRDIGWRAVARNLNANGDDNA